MPESISRYLYIYNIYTAAARRPGPGPRTAATTASSSPSASSCLCPSSSPAQSPSSPPSRGWVKWTNIFVLHTNIFVTPSILSGVLSGLVAYQSSRTSKENIEETSKGFLHGKNVVRRKFSYPCDIYPWSKLVNIFVLNLWNSSLMNWLFFSLQPPIEL